MKAKTARKKASTRDVRTNSSYRNAYARAWKQAVYALIEAHPREFTRLFDAAKIKQKIAPRYAKKTVARKRAVR